jgi:hypothetical protein
MGGQQLAERLAGEHPGSHWDLLPSLEAEPWFDAARGCAWRSTTCARSTPRIPTSCGCAPRRTARLVRWASRCRRAAGHAAALTRFERLMPASDAMLAYSAAARAGRRGADVARPTRARSSSTCSRRRARCGIPVAAAIMSWDHLSSKALLHLAPDA